jgi:hypothetical protein
MREADLNAQTQAEADQLAKRANERAAVFRGNPAVGYQAGYSPANKAIVSHLRGAGPVPQVDYQVSLAEWLDAIGRRDLQAWNYKIDRYVLPAELVILGRR